MNQTTATEVKKLLGPLYTHLVQSYDIRHRERRETERVKKRLLPMKCAGCGEERLRWYTLEAAHIGPLAECETTTLSNLVGIRLRRTGDRWISRRGWDVGFRATQLLLYGKLKLAQQSGRRGACGALPYLVRSLVGMVGLKQQQPEGIRDLLNAIAEALERSNDPCHKEVKRVAKMCVDFSSWFHPARALTRA